MQFRNFAAALGAGIGISEILGNMVDSAKKLDKAQTTLKNVSSSIRAYGENQQFVMDLSKKYNQELTTLMGNYAKFHSAANMVGMSLLEQQNIYESLTRAAAFYNLTADETNGVMLAVQQMISKGTVQAEELRGQLGERLVGAFNHAATAMGVSTIKLGDMIKSGEVLATDLLPKLAYELNKVTGNLDVDTVEGATNRMKNAFTNMVKTLNISDLYKKILVGVAKGLEYIEHNFKSIKQQFNAILLSFAATSVTKRIKDVWVGYFAAITAEVNVLNQRIMTTKSLLERHKTQGHITFDMDTQGFVTNLKRVGDFSEVTFSKIESSVKRYNKNLEEVATKTLPKAADVGKVAAGWAKVNMVFKSIGASLKSLWASYWPLLAVYAVTRVVQEWKEWRKEVERVRNLIKDTLNELDNRIKKLSNEEVELNLLKVAAFDTKSYDKERKGVIDQINKLLGTEFDVSTTNFEINKAINERLSLLKEERRYQEQIAEISDQKLKKEEAQKKIDRLKAERKEKQATLDKLPKGTAPGHNAPQTGVAARITAIDREIALTEEEIANIDKLIGILEENNLALAKNASERQKALDKPNEIGEITGDPTLEEEYKKIKDEYNKNLRTLNKQKEHQLLTEDEYNKELEKLVLKTAESILALKNFDENTDAFAKGIIDAAKVYVANAQKEDKVKEELDKYYKSVNELKQQYRNGLITSKQLSDGMFDLLQEVVMTVGGMKKLSGAASNLAMMFKQQSRRRVFDAIANESAPQMGEFDTTLSYKKESSEMYQENADYIRDYASQLDTYIESLKEYKDELTGDDLKQLNTYIEELEVNLDTLTTQADSFAQAAKFAEVQEDIKNMKKELAEGIWDNISGIATAAERLTNSFKSMKETLNNPEVDGWEKFITIFTTIISTIETIVSVIKTFNTALQIAEGLSMAMTAAEAAGIPVEIEKIALMTAEAQVAKQVAVAKHMSAAASVPYPANLAAIASTSAALAAAFAAIPAFAEGGYVKSASTIGDHNLVRVNGNELILNTQQQGTLWNLLNGSGIMNGSGSGNVSFEIRGDKLVGVLNNYKKKKSK